MAACRRLKRVSVRVRIPALLGVEEVERDDVEASERRRAPSTI
jgi:hypothetical protein